MSDVVNPEMSTRPIRVFLVDDHQMVRRCLRSIIERETGICISGEAAELISAVERIDAAPPDVMLVDLKLGVQDGTELLRYVQERWIGMKTIVVSQHDPELFAEITRDAGAWGYVCKEEAVQHMVPAIKAVYQGECYYSPRASRAL